MMHTPAHKQLDPAAQPAQRTLGDVISAIQRDENAAVLVQIGQVVQRIRDQAFNIDPHHGKPHLIGTRKATILSYADTLDALIKRVKL